VPPGHCAGRGGIGHGHRLAHHRLFLGCGNKMMVMMDSAMAGRRLAAHREGVDATAFDPGTQLAFASCGSGTVTIARRIPGQLTVVQIWRPSPGAHE